MNITTHSTAIKVSVAMLAYNHEAFIVQALESVLRQQTDFEYEIVISEDCSTDSTRAIVCRYAEQYPERIHLLLPDRNRGMHASFVAAINVCRGQYIAFLEGDDYWTDPTKLQKQVTFLDANSKYAMCFHNTWVHYETQDEEDRIAIVEPKLDLQLYDFIDLDYFRRKGGLISRGHTSSLMFRNHIIKEYPDWFYHSLSCDLPFFMLLAEYGKGRFINEFMSVYRKNPGGITNSTAHGMLNVYQNRLKMLDSINKHFGYQFDALIRRQKDEFRHEIFMYHLRRRAIAQSFLIFFKYTSDRKDTLRAVQKLLESLIIVVKNKSRLFFQLNFARYTSHSNV